MCVWRAFFAIYLDLWSFRGVAAARRDRSTDMQHFADSLRGAMLLSLAFCAVLQVRGAGRCGEDGCRASWLAGKAMRLAEHVASRLCQSPLFPRAECCSSLMPTRPLLQCLGGLVGEEQLELMVSSLLTGQQIASAAGGAL